MVDGLNIVPADDEPTIGEVNTVHLAWDVMIGMGTIMCLIAAWYWVSWIFRRRMPRSRWFLRVASATGIMSVIALESGWVVSEVGRQPWIVYNLMKVEAAATANTGRVGHLPRRGRALRRCRRHHHPDPAGDEPTVP